MVSFKTPTSLGMFIIHAGVLAWKGDYGVKDDHIIKIIDGCATVKVASPTTDDATMDRVVMSLTSVFEGHDAPQNIPFDVVSKWTNQFTRYITTSWSHHIHVLDI